MQVSTEGQVRAGGRVRSRWGIGQVAGGKGSVCGGGGASPSLTLAGRGRAKRCREAGCMHKRGWVCGTLLV